MNEDFKLGEAKYFNARMRLAEDHIALLYNLSAFLSAARSVMQYAREEALDKEGGQLWYDQQILHYRTLSFFKDKRNLNIHRRPIKVSRRAIATAKDTVHLSDDVIFKSFDGDGNPDKAEVLCGRCSGFQTREHRH